MYTVRLFIFIPMSTNITEALNQHFPFFDDDLKQVIIRNGQMARFKAGDVLMRSGQFMKYTLLITQGHIKLYTDGEDGEDGLRLPVVTVEPIDVADAPRGLPPVERLRLVARLRLVSAREGGDDDGEEKRGKSDRAQEETEDSGSRPARRGQRRMPASRATSASRIASGSFSANQERSFASAPTG